MRLIQAPGYKIPSITLTRFPFEEYHTHLDVPQKLQESDLQGAKKTLLDIITILENNFKAKTVKKGLFRLSHPRYNLYKKAAEPGISNEGTSDIAKKWNLLMNILPRMLNSGMTILESPSMRINFDQVLDYVDWEAAGIVELDNSLPAQSS